MAEKILEVKDLVVHYDTDFESVHAVNGISFSLERRQTLGLVGETGAGKTTTAMAILRLVPSPPGRIVGGQIVLDGEDLMQINIKEMRKIRGQKVSMIFQDPMTALNPVISVGDQITEVVRLHNKQLTRAQAEEQAMRMLETVGITSERFKEYPHQFSGGMKQRVIIAIALACNPELLIADEPTTALDVTIQAQVLDMMRKLKDELGTSMILITHDLGVVAEVCDVVAIMYAGEIMEYGTLAQILENKQHPYTIGLFDSIPDLDKDVRRLKAISGLMPDPSNLPSGCKFHPRCPERTDACASCHPEAVEIEPGHTVRCLKFAQKGDAQA